jgi:hypothetical protein
VTVNQLATTAGKRPRDPAPARTVRRTHIDDYLGPAETRFFGSGFRRVAYDLGETRSAGPDAIRLDAAVICPPEWSHKSGVAQRPHLSTLDVLILASEAAGRQLAPGTGRLRRIDIGAGTEPYEDGLARVRVESALAGREGRTLRFGATVANMRLRLLVDESAARATPLYGTPYHLRRQVIDDIELDGQRATAAVTLVPTDGDVHDARASMVDAFVVTLQLGQVLLYELDGLARGASSTLWMRQTTVTDDGGPVAPRGPIAAHAGLAATSVLSRRGERWRTATLTGELLGVMTRCAVAHRLPND